MVDHQGEPTSSSFSSTSTSNNNNTNLPFSFPNTLRTVHVQLLDQLNHNLPTGPTLTTTPDNRKFLCVWTGLKPTFNTPTFRHAIGDMLSLSNDKFRIVQVVGDSGRPFSRAGIEVARNLILSFFSEDDDDDDAAAISTETTTTKGSMNGDRKKVMTSILEYGYTASKYDVNWVVGDIVAVGAASNRKLRETTVANVVWESVVAIEEWGCEGSEEVGAFVFVYNGNDGDGDGDGGKETLFGDDLWVSDDVMNAQCEDVLLCLEGGPQAFEQAVSVARRGVRVVVLTGLRRDLEHLSAFSAAALLCLMCEEWQKLKNAEEKPEDEKVARIENVAIEYADKMMSRQTVNDQKRHDKVRDTIRVIMEHLACLEAIEVSQGHIK